MKNEKCRYGHVCTSGCQKDFDCPCQSEHCCALTDTCEGPEFCEDHFEKSLSEQLRETMDLEPMELLGK